MFLVALSFEVPPERPIGAFQLGNVVKHLCFADVPRARARGPSAGTAGRSSAASAAEENPGLHSCSRQAGLGCTCECAGCLAGVCGIAGSSRLAPAQKCIEVPGTTLLEGRLVWAPAAVFGVRRAQAAVSAVTSVGPRWGPATTLGSPGFAASPLAQDIDLEHRAEQILADDLADDVRCEESEIACALRMLVCPSLNHVSGASCSVGVGPSLARRRRRIACDARGQLLQPRWPVAFP
jgi:hypothetical protein